MSAGRMASLALALTLAAAVTALAVPREGRFPHARHAGLFPTCVGCHAGIVSGAADARFPAPATCASCHDGSRVARVEWNGPTSTPSNLRFSHVEHARKVVADSQRAGGAGAGDVALQCGACHRMEGDTRFLAVARAQPATCLACHAHAAPSHLDARTDCRGCHVTLAQATALPFERVAALPRPSSHEAPDFVWRHAPRDEVAIAQCATCHAQQSCARCHADARSQRSIATLAPDARVARLVAGRGGRWPLPASHSRSDWTFDHGADANRTPSRCATCHAQPSCRSCHIGTGASRAIKRLPVPEPGASSGVQLRSAHSFDGTRGERRPPAPAGVPPQVHDTPEPAPLRHPPSAVDIAIAQATRLPVEVAADTVGRRLVRVHQGGYASAHGTEASSQQLDCAGCHTQRFCSDCHAGEGRRRFHLANFVQRHASAAWGRERDCASCHNPEAFCRSCHVTTGLASRGGLNSAYHTRQPGWLLQHGQAARQGLESCTSCHAQRDCMQCHSSAGWNVSPHGRDFDAERMARRAPGLCTTCHAGDPLAGRR